jgi:hypothetical protein
LNYKDCVKDHLSHYKINNLGVIENGVWKGNNVPYSHILPIDLQDLNFLGCYRRELWNYIEEKNLRLHKDFHHLNSSQAVCLNFFFPLLVENQLDLLLQVLNVPNEEIEICEFEKVLSVAEGTNFDFYLKLKSGRQLFFEIKYTETKFGKVTSGLKYQQKYQDIYKHSLANKIRSGVNEYEELVNHYQLLRNVSHINPTKEDMVFIICPLHNTSLRNEYDYVMDNVVDSSLHKNICYITWESLVSDLQNILQDSLPSLNRMKENYAEFEEKYLKDM